ncbi:MAG: acetyl-CoA carboxylase biotin carboxyl carrier protein [Vicinamibacteria bacterium]
MNLKELKELLDLVLEKGITEFELEEKGVKVKIKKGHDSLLPPTPIAVTSGNPAAELPSSKVTAAPSLEKAATMEEVGVSLVRSPMVGTYYRAPEPSAPPFVNEGDRVKVGQVLCIIEAMKLMNEIESEESGEIVKVFVENGQPVQFGDELFSIRVSN